MYWLTPFHYVLEGMLPLLTSGIPIRCSENELAVFPPPPGQSCESYAGRYAQQSGGYVERQGNGDCGFCQYRSGTQFAGGFNVFEKNVWRDFGIVCKLHLPSSHLPYLFSFMRMRNWLHAIALSCVHAQCSPRRTADSAMRLGDGDRLTHMLRYFSDSRLTDMQGYIYFSTLPLYFSARGCIWGG